MKSVLTGEGWVISRVNREMHSVTSEMEALGREVKQGGAVGEGVTNQR